MCFAMAKIAIADDRSDIIWFCITFAVCLAALFIPLPFIRFLIAGSVSFGIMIAYKLIMNR